MSFAAKWSSSSEKTARKKEPKIEKKEARTPLLSDTGKVYIFKCTIC